MEKAKQLIALAKVTWFHEDWDKAYEAACDAWDNAETVTERNEATLLVILTENGYLATTTPAALLYSAFNRPGHTEIVR